MPFNPDIASQLNRLLIPAQDLTSLSFCGGAQKAQLHHWVQQLPLAQPQQLGMHFYRALPELVRLQASAEQRLILLEEIYSPLQHCLEALALRYLNQPLILPETALKTATLAQALQKHINNAYLVAVRDLCIQWSPDTAKPPQQAQLANAIYSALCGLGQQLMRNYQLYIPINSQVWNEIHALYQLAQLCGVQQLVPAGAPGNIRQQYTRLLLLACARPNQLRQDEVARTYKALSQLVNSAELDAFNPRGTENLYVLDTTSNRPPFYKSRVASHQLTQHILELRTTAIVVRLTQLDPAAEEAESPLLQLTPALTQHLIQSWSHLALRSFERQPVSSQIEVTVGLSNVHYYLANKEPFPLFLHQSKTLDRSNTGPAFQKYGATLKPLSTRSHGDDPWGDAYDISGTRLDGAQRSTSNIEAALLDKERTDYSAQHPVYTVPMTDRSAGGYGLEWRGDIPTQVRAGELLGLREQGRDNWSLGVVRWVHQIRGATQLGIQLLAPRALPVALSVVQKTGGVSEYLRALQIPELKIINQPASLITNAISFHEFTKVRLYQREQRGDHDQDSHLQLTRRLFATGAFGQFAFRELASPQQHQQQPHQPRVDDNLLQWE